MNSDGSNYTHNLSSMFLFSGSNYTQNQTYHTCSICDVVIAMLWLQKQLLIKQIHDKQLSRLVNLKSVLSENFASQVENSERDILHTLSFPPLK